MSGSHVTGLVQICAALQLVSEQKSVLGVVAWESLEQEKAKALYQLSMLADPSMHEGKTPCADVCADSYSRRSCDSLWPSRCLNLSKMSRKQLFKAQELKSQESCENASMSHNCHYVSLFLHVMQYQIKQKDLHVQAVLRYWQGVVVGCLFTFEESLGMACNGQCWSCCMASSQDSNLGHGVS